MEMLTKSKELHKTIKTTISCPNTICDTEGKVLPNGNYYFTITEYNDTYCKGSLAAKGKYGEFTFKIIDIIKMMSIAQSRLARRSGLIEEGMPDYSSPPISPENSNLKELNQNDVVHNYFYTPDQCSICLCMISENRKKLNCTHSFHKACINKWLAKDVRCPVCRTIHTEPIQHRYRRQSVPSHQRNARMEIEEERVPLPPLNIRHRYNNYVVPPNNYVNPNAYGKH